MGEMACECQHAEQESELQQVFANSKRSGACIARDVVSASSRHDGEYVHMTALALCQVQLAWQLQRQEMAQLLRLQACCFHTMRIVLCIC